MTCVTLINVRLGAKIVLNLGLNVGLSKMQLSSYLRLVEIIFFTDFFVFKTDFFLIFDSNCKIHLQLRYLNIKGVNECIFVNYCKGVFSLLNSGEMFLKSRNQDVCFYGSFDPRFQFKVKRVTKYS